MALVSRSPIKVTAAPSTAPQEAMAASLQAHIDELVQKNRTCEHTIRRLQQSLADEKERGVEVVSRLKVASQQEREEWREGCDSLLASHRIVHLRTRIELDKERMNVLLEREENRRERINILHRDYRLTLFQAKELELEAKISSLEEAWEDLTEEHEQDAQEYMERICVLEKDLQRVERLRKEAVSRIKAREAEFSSLQSEIATLRKENVTVKASSESASVNLERTSLQLEGVKTSLAELESTNAELKRTNTDLKRQLDRWQNLETKGGAEVEEMRKRRVELEVQVKELQGRVKELEKSEKEGTKTLQKERNKVEKLKKENDRMAEVTEDAQSIAKKAQDEYDEAAKQLRTAQRLIEKLQSEKLSKDQFRKGKRPAHEVELPTAGDETQSLDPSEREVEKVLAPAPKSQIRPRPAARGNAVEEEQRSPEEQEKEEEPVKARGRIKAKNRKQEDEVETSTERNNGAQQPERAGKGRPRLKGVGAKAARRRKEKSSAESEQEEDAGVPDNKGSSRRSKNKGKEKAVVPPSDSEGEPRAESNGKSNKRDKADASDEDIAHKADGSKRRTKSKDSREDGAVTHPPSQPKARKPSSTQGPRQTDVDNTGEADARPKKKVRKLFQPSQPETFQWDVLPKGEGFGGLIIPTQLSPVKETDTVPTRSVIGNVGSALGFK